MKSTETITDIVNTSLSELRNCCAYILNINNRLRQSTDIIYDCTQQIRLYREAIANRKDEIHEIILKKEQESNSDEIERFSELEEEYRQEIAELEEFRDELSEKRRSEQEKLEKGKKELDGYIALRDQHITILKKAGAIISEMLTEQRRSQLSAFQKAGQFRFGKEAAGKAVSGIESDMDALNHLLTRITNEVALEKGSTDLQADNLGYWEQNGSGYSIGEALEMCNPNFHSAKSEWIENCQRCVPTYEMLRRGYKVTSREILRDDDLFAFHSDMVWENPEILRCGEDYISDISQSMLDWGDGARAQIRFQRTKGSGHTLIAEQVNGKTVFVDPQTGEICENTAFVFFRAKDVSYFRIDTLMPNRYILECCKSRK